MSTKKQRSVAENAAIGIFAGGVGGVANATLTHPIDSLVRLQQDAAKQGKVLNFGLKDYAKAYIQKDKWGGVGSSALRKGLGFGIGLGATFAAESQLKKILATIRAKEQLKDMGFHKTAGLQAKLYKTYKPGLLKTLNIRNAEDLANSGNRKFIKWDAIADAIGGKKTRAVNKAMTPESHIKGLAKGRLKDIMRLQERS